MALGLLLLLHAQASLAVIEIVIVGGADSETEPFPAVDLQVRRISESDIERQGLHSLEQLLAHEPGIQLRSLGGEGSFSLMSLRGSSARQVAVYVDGQRINGAEGLPVDLSQFPLSMVESVELFLDRQPIGFSRPGAAGAIRIRLRKSSSLKRIRHSVGSHGLSSSSFTSSWKSNRGSLRLNLDRLRADNDFTIRNDNGTEFNPHDDRREPRYNNAVERDVVDLEAQRSGLINGLTGRLGLRASDHLQQTPNRQNDPQNRAFLRKQQGRLSLELAEAGRDEPLLALRLAKGRNRFQDPDSDVGLEAQDNRYDIERIELSTGGRLWTDAAILPGQWSLSLAREDYRSETRLGSLGFVPDVERFREDSLSAGVELDIRPDDSDTTWSPQLRYEQRRSIRRDDDRVSGTDSSLSMQLAFSRELPAGVWTGFAGRYRRFPGFGERYADHGFTVGNPDLREETVDSLSSGFQWRSEGAGPIDEASVQAYLRQSRDLIVVSYDARGIGHYDNISSALIGGFEVKASGRRSKSLQWEASYALIQSRVDSEVSAYDGKHVPNSPQHALDLYLGKRLERFPTWRYRLRYHLEQGAYYDRANLLPVKAIRQFDAGLEWRNKRWKLMLWIYNLADRPIETFNGFPGPGRRFQLSLALDF